MPEPFFNMRLRAKGADSTHCSGSWKCLFSILIVLRCISTLHAQDQVDPANQRLIFSSLPALPDPIGVAGPIVGVRFDSLIVAGGANFAPANEPRLWDEPKKFLDHIWVLERTEDQTNKNVQWSLDPDKLRLSRPVAYSAVVDSRHGILVMGGENENGLTNRVYLLDVNNHTKSLGWAATEYDLEVPDLPLRCKGGGAAVIGDHVYLVAGEVQNEHGNVVASRIVWRFDLTTIDLASETDVNDQDARWEQVVSWPIEGPPRMFPLVTAQHDGFTNRLFVFGGRHFPEGSDASDANNLKFGVDCWSFDPSSFDAVKGDVVNGKPNLANPWKRIADAPVPLTAGTAIAIGPAHVIVPGYATGEILKQQLDSGLEMKDFVHPGFPRLAYAYHTITDTWTEFGAIPVNQVTTPAVRWGDDILLVSGEISPRVRSNQVWRINVREDKRPFGVFNMTVVVVYLLAMVGIGVFFTFRNNSTDDYFRGGKSVPWWAAGCSIFATMLSSITYMAVPAKAFAQDWVYSMGNLLILFVAPIAIYVALPFFRRIDATSAYEYLEKRFNRTARLIGSGSFSLFHIFRMGVVLALAALALASVTPLDPVQCVIVMGLLSIIYCTLGGIEAVIWTDTIQTFILLGGALACLVFAFQGSDPGSIIAAFDSGKFHLANLDFGSTSFMTMAIWVVVIGGFGQNLASYTADQAVVQRYMTTPDETMAARSIWLNGFMALPAAVIFFGMGTAFWMFYRSHPDKLDPTMASDRIMPHFISQELPVGLAGLVVAGIFAAAQSTVSTSMNSGATTIVTDFVKPLGIVKSDKACLWLARWVTLTMGILGTAAGLLFIDPSIKSLFDQFVGILGMFLGVLAGLFALGATTRRANGPGSLIGAAAAIGLMVSIVFAAQDKTILGFGFRGIFELIGTRIYQVNGYLYAFVGIAVCYVIGYIASLAIPGKRKPLKGLTLWE